MVVEGDVSNDEYSGGLRLNCKELYHLSEAREMFAKRLRIGFGHQQAEAGLLNELASQLTSYQQGNCPIVLNYQNSEAEAELNFGNDWRIRPDEQLLDLLRELLGNDKVNLEYR